MKPSLVINANKSLIIKLIKKNISPKIGATEQANFKTGDCMLIIKQKIAFAKGYTPSCNKEIFTVHCVQSTVPITYMMKYYTGEALNGGFYEHEISACKVGDVISVEYVVQQKFDRVRLRWLGFNCKHQPWIHKRD